MERWVMRLVGGRSLIIAMCALVALLSGADGSVARAAGASGDPAVAFMHRVGRDLLAASRARSPQLLANAVKRYGDVAFIGQYSLGSYRTKLAAADQRSYLDGMVRFIGRYAAQQAPKYPVVKYEIAPRSVQGGAGLMVDSRITMRDGSTYDVRWLLAKYGNSYRVRDAMVYGFWMTPFLKQLFETYIGENGGNVRSLIVALNR